MDTINLIDGVIKDMLEIDPNMTLSELYEHCLIIGKHDGMSESKIREEFQANEQLKKKNGNIKW